MNSIFNKKNNCCTFCFIFLFICVFFSVSSWTAFSAERAKETEQNAKVTLRVTKEPLRSIVERAAEQTGYRIEVSEKLLDMTVSGNFTNIQIEDLFRRILKDQNLFFIGDNEKKVLKIYTSLKGKEQMFIADAGGGSSFREGSYQEFLASRDVLDERIRRGEVDLDLEPDVSFNEFLASRDTFEGMARSGELELELEPGISFNEMVVSRDAFDEKISSGAVELELDPSVSFNEMVVSRDAFDEKISSGTVKLELDPGVSFKEMVAARDSLDKEIRSGEVELILEPPGLENKN